MENKSLKFFLWLIFEICVPIAFVVAVWPIAEYLLRLPHSFERTLSGADLMPLAALILIGTVLETTFDDAVPRNKNVFLFMLTFTAFLAIMLLFTYGFMKAESFKFDIAAMDSTSYDGKMTLFSKVAFVSILVSSVFAVFLKLFAWYLSLQEK